MFFCCAGHLKICFWGLSSLSLCLIPLSSSSCFLPVQTFLLFCQILMVELDTGFPFWRLFCSSFLTSTGWHVKTTWSYVSVQFYWCWSVKYDSDSLLLLAVYPYWIKWFLQTKVNKIWWRLNREGRVLFPVLLPVLSSQLMGLHAEKCQRHFEVRQTSWG